MKEGRSRRSFRLKVEVLEKAAIEGVIPTGVPIIGNVGDLRAWNDPPKIAWCSFSVAAPSGPNADLRARFDKILPTFVKLQTGKPKRGPRPPKNTTVEQWLIRAERNALVLQNADLLFRIEELETTLGIQNAVVASSKAKIAELTAQLRTLTSFKPLERKT